MTAVVVPAPGNMDVTIGDTYATWRRAAAMSLTFRRAVDDDLPLLAEVYASTRAEELALVPWSDTQKSDFLTMQFNAQHTHYRAYYPDADWLIILRDGEPAGRLYLERWRSEHRIIDITLLPAWRGHGFGSAILQDLLDVAGADGKAMSIHVEKFNPAKALYLRLGFVVIEDKGVYDLMRWSADQPKTAS